MRRGNASVDGRRVTRASGNPVEGFIVVCVVSEAGEIGDVR